MTNMPSPQPFPSWGPGRVGAVTLADSDNPQTRREKLARIVLDEMYQFVGLLDADGMTLEINRAALEGAGLNIEDIRGKPFWEARWFQVSREAVEQQRLFVQRARAGEFIRCDTEVYGRAAGEETIVVDFSLLPVKNAQGQVVFLLAEGRNITEKKRAEAEVARKTAELETLLNRIRELDQLKSDLFANVSHELRTPLALIHGPAEELLARGDNLTDDQRRSLGVIRRNAATLLKHINDLLDLARRDAQQLSPRYVRVDLAAMLRTVAGQFHALAPRRHITYVVDVPERVVGEVDEEKIERVVLNLLSNAFKFTPDGGRIRCTLQALSVDRALISVQDSGPGISPEMQQAVFERFRQLQTGTTRDVGGTGLGLAIAKEFVELHGGAITVTTAPGGGALFQVEIPLRAPAGSVLAPARDVSDQPDVNVEGTLAELTMPGGEPDAAVESVSSPSSTGASSLPSSSAWRPTVLVVEDNAEMRRFVCDALAPEHHVLAANDGAQALATALGQPPDLVVTDLMMPRMGGDLLVERMRTHAALADVPVLVLSAKDDDALRARLLAHLVQDYVTKPFSAQELRARVRNLTTMKRARDVLRRELASQGDDVAQLTQQLVDSVAEQRRSDDALARARNELARVSRASTLGELAASIAHEVNQPLAAIVANGHACMRWMGTEPAGDVEARAAVQRIIDDGNRASQIILRVRRFLRQGDLQRESVDMADVVDDVLELVRKEMHTARVAVQVSAAADRPTVHADRVQIQQVVLNLVMNALEAMQADMDGARALEITTAAEPADVNGAGDAGGAGGAGGAVRLSVRDNGKGIDAQDLDRVFEAFHTTKPGGMGMGLAISRSIVEAHGGRLWVTRNHDGPGVTFAFTLPRQAE